MNCSVLYGTKRVDSMIFYEDDDGGVMLYSVCLHLTSCFYI